MTTAAIREKLHQFIDTASEQHIEMVYNFIQAGLVSNENSSHWDDPSFVAEMDRRVEALENGSDKGYTWDEVKQMARNSQTR